MLTIFSVPKPFEGRIGEIQRRAVASWAGLGDDVQVLLLGDEPGTGDAARAAGATHLPDLARTEHGTPRLDAAFAVADAAARHSLRCFVNADVVLFDDLPRAAARVHEQAERFLVVGQTVDVGQATNRDDGSSPRGRRRGAAALDYFVFTAGLYTTPPFSIGRACFDNWLVWRAPPGRDRRRRDGGRRRGPPAPRLRSRRRRQEEAYYGVEAARNLSSPAARAALHAARRKPRPSRRTAPPQSRRAAPVARERPQGRLEAGRPLTRVAFVSPEPTPYRAPLLDRVAATGEVDLTVIYAAHTVARRTWKVEPLHRAVFLDGLKIPGVRGVFRHDYPVTPGIWKALREARPDCVVVSGWSTFAAQAALSWCRARRVPYVLLVESHDAGPKPGWRRRVKETVVPPIVKRAASVLVTGSLARESMLGLGASGARSGVREHDRRRPLRRAGGRAGRAPRGASRRVRPRARRRGCPDRGPARAGEGIDVLLRAAAQADLPVLVVGEGAERTRLEQLARELEVRATFTSRPWDEVVEAYVAADVFALLSAHEPWGVVVNEAAACGLPLVLSERVGAARDLLRDGENGVLVPAGDVTAAAAALRRLAGAPELRRRMGARSRDLARGFGYGPSVDSLLAASARRPPSR